jgi:Stress responsive A/B Barrel Domain
MVAFRWTDQATAEQKAAVSSELSRLPSLVPTVRSFELGTDIGVNEGNGDFAVCASFDDLEGYLVYRDNPDHQAMIRDLIRPIMEQRLAVQFEY